MTAKVNSKAVEEQCRRFVFDPEFYKRALSVFMLCSDGGDDLDLAFAKGLSSYLKDRRLADNSQRVTGQNVPLPMNVPGYESLARVLELAYDQSVRGKRKLRHAKDKPFDQQPIMEIARMVGLGGHTYQISKKAQEATSMAGRGDKDAALAELLGVIVYAAAAYNLVNESMEAE